MITVFKNIRQLVTLKRAAEKDGRKVSYEDLSIEDDGVMISRAGKILWCGRRNEMPEFRGKRKSVDLKGATVLPAFVDCHTHAVFSGDRRHEFELRNQGRSYQEIAASGGGIQATVKATRETSAASLLSLARSRAEKYLRQGVVTLEVKSGYGLDEETEIKVLKTAKKLSVTGQRIITTFLGPHSVPSGKSAEAYIEECIGMLGPVRKSKLADRVDIFVEKGFFTGDHAVHFLDAAAKAGFKGAAVHLDQLSRSGFVETFVQRGVLSLDHCVHLSDQDIEVLAPSRTTAVLLPISDLYLNIDYPPARKLIDSGARVALATDFNPGTAPSQDLSLLGVLSRLKMRMSLAEVLCAITYGGAAALGLEEQIGSLEAGKEADFVVLDGELEDLFYEIGHHPVRSVWRGAKPLYLKKS